jgi:hypothetical protein
MHERKMGLAETPRRVPAIAAVCRVSLLRVDWYRNRSLPICRHPCFLLSLLGGFFFTQEWCLVILDTETTASLVQRSDSE